MRFEQIIHWMKQLNGKANSALYAPLLKQNNSEHIAFIRNLEKEMERENTLFTPLEDCCSYYGIDIHERHHALGDAKMTAQLWTRSVKKLQELGFQTLFDVYQGCRK
ncbi:hypothetical protein [Bacillus sp. FJAT-52991]|uniref:DNA polymerase III subunit epsilon n=1 Tax=Bacillus kandeliae TaxID=3129297 RepID=A0ABZ2N8Y6_9BACI